MTAENTNRRFRINHDWLGVFAGLGASALIAAGTTGMILAALPPTPDLYPAEQTIPGVYGVKRLAMPPLPERAIEVAAQARQELGAFAETVRYRLDADARSFAWFWHQLYDWPGERDATPIAAAAPAPTGERDRAEVDRIDLMPVALDQVRDGTADVPRLFLPSLPSRLLAQPDADERKSAFVKALLPHLLRVNEDIRADRARLIAVKRAKESGDTLGDDDRAFIEDLAERYGTSPRNLVELKQRVDIVPPSLAIAQAAEESGWGTARVAHHRNALFGEMTMSDGRAQLRAFDAIENAVISYVMNLNSHNAYRGLRQMRAEMRAKGKEPSGFALAGALHRYSERGQDYVRTIRALLRVNGLDDFDRARLDDGDQAGRNVVAIWR